MLTYYLLAHMYQITNSTSPTFNKINKGVFVGARTVGGAVAAPQYCYSSRILIWGGGCSGSAGSRLTQNYTLSLPISR